MTKPRRAIERVGGYLDVDAGGFLRSGADAALIVAPWRSAVESLVAAYRHAWGDELHGIYVRGSVAKGMAIEGLSDLDSFAVQVAGGTLPTWFDDWAGEVEREIGEAFPFVAGVEVDLHPLQEVRDRGSVHAFILATEAACVDGTDLSRTIDPYRIGPEIAFQTRYFGRHLEHFLRAYPVAPSRRRLELVVWMARRFLRLGLELVMVQEGRYTRDLFLCHESFAKHHPRHGPDMYRVLEVAVNPVADDGTLAFLRAFGRWLAGEAERRLRTWGYRPTADGQWERNGTS